MQATVISHPNVALIKYWGKEDAATNLPAVGSLSLTLGGLSTRTHIRFDASLEADSIAINGQTDDRALARVTRCLDLVRNRAGVTERARVETENDFPTGAGLASSASGFAALTKAAEVALGLELPAEERDLIARIGSGSAPRSLYDGIVLLEKTAGPTGTRCRSIAAPDDWPLSIVVAVTSRLPKDVSSTGGMESSRETSPLYASWVSGHPADLTKAVSLVEGRDFDALAALSEHSCLKMHAVAMTSDPALVYWSGATVNCMQRVRELRAAGVPAFFTIDAGPQVKIVCPAEQTATVHEAMAEVPGVVDVIDSPLGYGAKAV